MKTRFKDSGKPLIPYLHGNPAALAGDNHPVFFLKRILRDYDLSSILNRYPSETVGRPPFDPFLMILLVVFAYYESIRSTRKMEEWHGDSIGVRVIFPMR
ncbi:MAG: transposase, partial [Leptospirales bacterium]